MNQRTKYTIAEFTQKIGMVPFHMMMLLRTGYVNETDNERFGAEFYKWIEERHGLAVTHGGEFGAIDGFEISDADLVALILYVS